jgi:hypothetical protein
MSTKLIVDPWAPNYGTSVGFDEDGPDERSPAALDSDLEMPADEWRPIGPRPGVSAPDVVYFVDGVRRLDARVWLEDDDETYAGIAASLAAGAVRCDTSAGVAEVLEPRIERGIYTAAPDVGPIGVEPARYEARRVEVRDPNRLVNAAQSRLEALEREVSGAVARDGDLLVADGRLRARVRLANAVGYVKTHHSRYLPERLTAVVTGLHPGQRTPIFTIGTQFPVHTWYLRLPGPGESAWAGMVRIECDADLSTDAAVALADLTAVTLPAYASAPHKDPRAPQNLVPISGLERRLRASLGDPRLLHRALVRGAAVAASVTASAEFVADATERAGARARVHE